METLYTVRSIEELDNLKREWSYDPCWDIEDTHGYELWHDELKCWRERHEAQMAQIEAERIGLKTAELGINAALLKYIELLELRIARLEHHTSF